jgi:hypothetical protein
MSDGAITLPPVLPEATPPPSKTLRRLFLTLFLRGRGARGLNKAGAPKSVGQKLALTLTFYGLFGCMALYFLHQPVFGLAVYTHAMTFVFLGMFVASSAGEILFNKEEADILLHRPVTPQTMLWAKVRVLVEVSLWLAYAFNLVGLIAGYFGEGGWLFPVVHLVSVTFEALFCTGCVVLIYQLCLKWFGRERLENLMTTAQVLVSVAAVTAGQVLPQMVVRIDHSLNVSELPWWLYLLPPAWFAGFDDALAGTHAVGAWALAGLAAGVTALVLWLAFSKLARDYERGLQAIGETASAAQTKGGHGRWLARLVQLPPVSWWLRDPVSRASFLLTAAYLFRDRETKLRIYPGLAPVLFIPVIFLMRGGNAGHGGGAGFGIPFAGVYLGLVPLLGLQMLQYSQQWQAADVFRAAPMAGPGPICRGARGAVLGVLACPMILLVALFIGLVGNWTQLALFVPGLLALPVLALVPSLFSQGVPLSQPADAAKAAGRGLNMIAVMMISFLLAGVASYSWNDGWFWKFVAVEAVVAAGCYALMRWRVDRMPWPSME